MNLGEAAVADEAEANEGGEALSFEREEGEERYAHAILFVLASFSPAIPS